MIFVWALARIEALSDHVSILLTTENPKPQHRRPFNFELGCLHINGFSDIVTKIWEKPVTGLSPIQRWNNELCSMRIYPRVLKKETQPIIEY
jgi:hypothetical protein